MEYSGYLEHIIAGVMQVLMNLGTLNMLGEHYTYAAVILGAQYYSYDAVSCNRNRVWFTQ